MRDDHVTTQVQGLADFVVRCRDDGVPDEVERNVRRRVGDTLGVSIAALPLDTSRAILGHVLHQGGRPEAHVLGSSTRVPAAQAALSNGVLAHSLDYDDTHLPSILHPSASVVPAALATAEAVDTGGQQLTSAIAAGLEVCVRLGMAGYDLEARNSTFFQHGQHATSICGAIGSAAAAGALLGLGTSGVAHAMAIAVSFASGVIEGNRTGGTVKRTHCGWAASAGVTAAQLAQRGFTGPPTALEGSFGFFEAFLHGRYDRTWVEEGLGESWEVPGIFVKPYPANHFTHAGIDAATHLRSAGLDLSKVTAIELAIATPTVRSIGEPLDAKRRPSTAYQAQFSGPYTVVAALLGGGGLGLGLGDFDEALVTAPERQELMDLVTVVGDPACDAVFPDQFPAIVRVKTRDGSEFEKRVMTTRGGPARPLSDDDILRKLEHNVGDMVSSEALDALRAITTSVDGLADPGGIMHLAASAGSAVSDEAVSA